MKISGYVEQIFAQAVALDQNGGLKNTIYASGKEVFILNYDHTVLMRFRLRKSESPFKQAVSFRANDYDSDYFYEEDGNIIFVSEKNGFQRKKSCRTPDFDPEVVAGAFKSYLKTRDQSFTLSKDILPMLDRNLSHIEITGEKGGDFKIVQRNIYSGGVIEVTPKNQKSGLLNSGNNFKSAFGPIALKTNDFLAMYNFQDVLKWTPFEDYLIVDSVDKIRRDMTAIISGCLYDEVIEIKKARESM